MSTKKVNGENRERLRQSAKRSAAVRGQAQWQADVSRVRQSRKSGFSSCQVLWKIAGRSALFPSWARPERERELWCTVAMAWSSASLLAPYCFVRIRLALAAAFDAPGRRRKT